MQPYVGVTGFTTRADVESALSALPQPTTRNLMVGVLASWKSLHGLPLKPVRQKRFPQPEKIREIFVRDGRALNLVHYSTEEEQINTLVSQLFKIHDLAGPNLDGFQLNITWPLLDALEDYRMRMGSTPRLVLQIGQTAINIAESAHGIAKLVFNYRGFVDSILLDASGGLGKPLDARFAHQVFSEIVNKGWTLGLGVAGGLGPNSLDLVAPLIEEFPALSIDAEGLLRNKENELDNQAVKTYLKKAFTMFT